ncbi:DNRLRE domain-containing protein [Streptomyces sp. NPDC048629]|uniref:golvesin C-terminal-like domain-containing protein n=1 Tax=Streptomyces sp. NPDC048629 TaxID=3154824 RepID=UPI0034426E6E
MNAPSRRLLTAAVAAAMAGTLIQPVSPAVADSKPQKFDEQKWRDELRDWETSGRKGDPPVLPAEGVVRNERLPKGRPAAKAVRVAELTARRTPNSRSWLLSDGRVQAEVSVVPTSYRDGKTWKTLDPAVTPTDRAGFDFANTTNTGRSWFGSDPKRMLRFETEDGHAVTLGLVGAGGKLKPGAKGSTVTYPNALPGGTDLSYQVGPGRVKENIVLARKPAGPVSFTFTLDAGGLTPKARKDGSVEFYGEAKHPVLVIPPAFMTDARKDADSPYGHASSDKVAQTLTRSGKGWRLTVTPDAKWLAAPERQYPVTVDPTLTIAPTPSESQDTMILSSAAGTNFNDTWRLSAGLDSAGNAARTLVRFGLSGVPAGTKLEDARLQMYYDQTHTGVSAGAPVTLGAYRATTGWTAGQANWSNANGLVGELAGSTTLADDGDAGTTAAQGAWPSSSNTAFTQYAINRDYLYNKDSTAGDTYTWQPKLPEDGTYQVDAHVIPADDRSTAVPYTITYDGGSKPYTVDQKTGTGGVWKPLGAHPFKAGTAGKVVLGDGPASATTAVIADAVRFTKPGTVSMPANTYNKWHSFSVKDTVQSWIDGTQTNNGFVVKAVDETAGAPKGGPRYEASEFGYGGETVNYPKLVLTYGRPSVTLNAPSVIHDTGAELTWSGYTDPSTAAGDDLAEYQVHRSVYQTFTPSASTLVAPVSAGTTAYTDTSATPTPADDADPFGRAYYYMVAVKTKDGQVVPAPTQLVRLPKAGRTTKVVEAAQDTTLSSTESTLAHDTIQDGAPQNWVTVGNNSPTYGKTRTLLKFPALGIPATARVLDADIRLWGTQTSQQATGAVYELRPLTRDFDEATATWAKANATTSWTTAGGDTGAPVADTVPALSNDPARHEWSVTSLAQGWVTTPASQQGVLIKTANESVLQERTIFLSSEATEQRLRPRIVVTYIDSTTESTYYAPQTPARMIPGDTHNVEVTLTNTTASVWRAADRVLSYTWALPDGTDRTTGGNQVETALPADVSPGETVTVQAQVKTPINSDEGNKRTDYVLTWDLRNKTAATWLSATDGIAGLKQNVAVEDPTSDQLGLEKFYSYAGENTGAGSSVMNNTAAGNTVWQYNAFSNPGRGLGTFVRFAYNSLDTSDTVLGHGWSAQAAGPIRLGAALDFHPNPNPTEVTLPDGDGTAHVFRWDAANSVWKAPAGVHYLLQQKAGVDCKPSGDGDPQAWSLTRPDRTQFFFDCDGFLTSVVDKNGNTQTYTYEERKSNNKPVKFLRYITDPAGRQTLTVEYYSKADSSNPKIIDHVKSMTDISERKVTFAYSDKGLLTQLTDGAGSSQPKVFGFEYDATQGNKNVKLVKVTDPRGNATQLAYNYPQTGDDPKFHWWTKTVTDRLGGTTGFVYTDPDGSAGSTIESKVTDSENHTGTYLTDGYGRVTQITNAANQTTKMGWDADNNVTRLEEVNGAVSTWSYDPKTGYPLEQKDAEANKNGTAAATFTYQTGLNGHVAELFEKKSPEGRSWRFGYDTRGNLTAVTDPKGVETATADDYTTKYEYNAEGLLTKATDANGNATVNSDFGPTGYPAKITDALQKSASYVYDERGQVRESTDALGKKTTQTYDVYGRPLESTVPKDQAAGELITTPAPVYDANDNVTTSTSPNGAVSTAVYDKSDQVTEATAPKDTPTQTARRSLYTYDKVGNLLTTTEPKGAATGTDPDDYRTTNHYDVVYQLTSTVNAAGDTVSYAYDNVGNATKVVDPKKNATADPDDYTSKTAFDLNHRVVSVTDAAGKTAKREYDKDSLVTATVDQENNRSLIAYDARAKTIEMKVPHDGASPIEYRTSKFEYDQAGNATKVITPRGVNTAATDDFTSETVYDALNRPTRQIQPYDPADARYNKKVWTETSYDEVGRVSKVSAPPSEGQTVRNDTSYSYFDNGWVKSSTDPWDIVSAYGYNDLGQQTARTLTSAGGSSGRTMGWDYYPDGKLKTRTDDGVPVGSAVVLVDNSDTQNTSATGTWTKGSLTGQQGYDHQVQAAGTGTEAFTWTLNIPKNGTYTAYVKYPKVTGAATAAKYTVTKSDGTTTDVTRDQNAAAGTWVSLGSYSFTQGNAAKLQLFRNSAGAVVADGVKFVRDNSGDSDTEKRTFTYGYDLNGNLTSIDDTSSGTKIDAYTMTYTGLNQVQKITEALAGQEKRSTSYVYDANGQPDTVTHPDQFNKYTYDLRELVKTVSVGKDAADASPKVTGYTYTDRGQKLRETKANRNTVDYTYFLDGEIKNSVEKKADGTLVAEHTYAYDANGNKARDTAKKMNADNHAAYLSSTTDFTYDPADRLASSVKTGNGASTETYVHDDNANVISQTVKGTSTTFTYDRNRLLKATSGGTTATYNYDPFGRQESVTGGGEIVSRSVYDGFDHVVESSKLTETGGQEVTKYTFDPLDRTATKTVGTKTTDFSYLGLSNEILGEAEAGRLTKSYQYSPWGERLSQIKHNTDGTTEDSYYGYNSHTDVETLTGNDGTTRATYGYTAYGKDDTSEFTGIDKPDTADPNKEAYNPYRFNAKRWDAQSGTYDMGFRDYSPGLNRFTSRDMYNGALADMRLGSDPMTGNRYAFTGGNPVSFVELDGHCYPAATCYGGGDSSGTSSGSSGSSECDQYGYHVKDACLAAGSGSPTGDGGDFLWGMGRMIASTLEFIGEAGPGCWFQDCVTIQEDYDKFAEEHGADTGSDMYESGEVVANLPFLVRGAFSMLRRLAAGAEAASATSVWKLPANERGIAIEDMRGGNLPNSFPTIDRWDAATGTATSIKSIDTTLASYQKASGITGLGRKYVRDMANFNGRTWRGTTVDGSAVQNRRLEIGVPPGMSSVQQQALNDVVTYGQQQGVVVEVFEVP